MGGCDGGDLPTALHYLEKAGGQDTNADYPDRSHQTGNTQKCKWDKKEVVKVTDFKYAVQPCSEGACKNQDEDKLAAALAHYGPLSICLNAEVWDDFLGRGRFHPSADGRQRVRCRERGGHHLGWE